MNFGMKITESNGRIMSAKHQEFIEMDCAEKLQL